MSNNEGKILKRAIDDGGYTIEEFSSKMGYAKRTGLVYHLGKEKIPFEIKERAAALLGKSVEEIFTVDSTKKSVESDSEKEALRELVDAQRELIDYWKEMMLAQSIRIEALQEETLYQLAEMQIQIDPSKRKLGLKALLSEGQLAVQDRIQKLREKKKLGAVQG